MTDEKQLEYLLEDRCVAGINVIGKRSLVSSLLAKAGDKIKKSISSVENNGNFIVLSNADINLAAKLAVKSICKFAGQDFHSPKIYFIMDQVYDQFKQKLIANLNSIMLGDPTMMKTQYGPSGDG